MVRTFRHDSARPASLPKFALLAMLAVAVLAASGCSDTLPAGLSLFAGEPEPAESLEEIEQAVLARDEAAFDAYFDLASVADHAYAATIEQLRQTPEYQDMVTQLGEEQAEEILKEDVLSYDLVVQRVSETFSLAAIPDGQGFFGTYEITSSEIGEYEAELTVTANAGAERTLVLGMVMETDPDRGQIWRVKEIRNITELIDFQES